MTAGRRRSSDGTGSVPDAVCLLRSLAGFISNLRIFFFFAPLCTAGYPHLGMTASVTSVYFIDKKLLGRVETHSNQ